MPTTTTRPRVLHLSTVAGGALRDADGQRLGRVDDLIVRLGGTGYPPITGFLVTVAGRSSYLPAERASDLGIGSVTLAKAKLDLRPFARRPEEVLLKHDVLDHQLINVDGARLVRANEVELARVEGWWRVVGLDTGVRGGLRRLLPRPLSRRVGLGEAASHREGEEIIRAVGQDDRELEADVFEELDDRHQSECPQRGADGRGPKRGRRRLAHRRDRSRHFGAFPGTRRGDRVRVLSGVPAPELRPLRVPVRYPTPPRAHGGEGDRLRPLLGPRRAAASAPSARSNRRPRKRCTR